MNYFKSRITKLCFLPSFSVKVSVKDTRVYSRSKILYIVLNISATIMYHTWFLICIQCICVADHRYCKSFWRAIIQEKNSQQWKVWNWWQSKETKRGKYKWILKQHFRRCSCRQFEESWLCINFSKLLM